MVGTVDGLERGLALPRERRSSVLSFDFVFSLEGNLKNYLLKADGQMKYRSG